jgi:hypothetical protein
MLQVLGWNLKIPLTAYEGKWVIWNETTAASDNIFSLEKGSSNSQFKTAVMFSSIVINQISIPEDIKSKLNSGTACYHSVLKLLSPLL